MLQAASLTILLDKIRISGFRGLENIEVALPRIAILIGPNNCGKTSVLKAIHLAVGDYSRQLTEADFRIDDKDLRTPVISVDIRLISTDTAGVRQKTFDRDWLAELGDKVRADADGNQFVAYRTTAQVQAAKEGFLIERHILNEWPTFTAWLSVATNASQKFLRRIELVPLISIDAQRDISTELNERTSFVGRILSLIKYDPTDVAALQDLIQEVNEQAVAKSSPLRKLATHLELLNDSFGGSGKADVTPFPKKLRDISKNFSIHFGSTAASSFSMEYHGMGTRSWASMLAVKAFVELATELQAEDAKPLHPVVTAEEPEAHLHPNAQRSLFAQLLKSNGQTIISTHSPYLAAMADIRDLRSLTLRNGRTQCFAMTESISSADMKQLNRDVLKTKGEVLFARALVLYEGPTEDQVVPAMFERWFGSSPFTKGVTLISADGNNYCPLVKLSGSLGIPVVIMSDNDSPNGVPIRDTVIKLLAKAVTESGVAQTPDWFAIEYLSSPNDFEAELVSVMGLRAEIEEAFLKKAKSFDDNPKFLRAQSATLASLTDGQLIARMRAEKTGYSGFLADVILDNTRGRPRDALVPPALQNLFTVLDGWLK